MLIESFNVMGLVLILPDYFSVPDPISCPVPGPCVTFDLKSLATDWDHTRQIQTVNNILLERKSGIFKLAVYEVCSIVLQSAGVRIPGHHCDHPD